MTEGSRPWKARAVRVEAFLKSDDGQRFSVVTFLLVSLLVLWAFPGGAMAYVFGLPLMFFVPGFTVVRLFFWRGTSVEAKFVLSIGLSVIVVILLGLFLTLTPVGLNSDTTRASLAVFVLGAVGIERFGLQATRGSETQKEIPQPEQSGKIDKVVVAMLAVALVVSGISLGLVITADHPSRTYFAVTDSAGQVIMNTTYHRGTNITLLLTMKNGEDGPRNFTLSVYGLDTFIFPAQAFSKRLDKGEIWEQTVAYNLTDLGIYRLDFDLYIQDDNELPYLYGNLHLWIYVVEATVG